MEVLFEIFIEIIFAIAEIIGSAIAKTVDGSLTKSSSVKRVTIYALIGIINWAVIIALGFGSYILFLNQHPIAGFLVAVTAFFFIALFICVIVMLYKIKKDKIYNKK